jgi:hypothetical protein
VLVRRLPGAAGAVDAPEPDPAFRRRLAAGALAAFTSTVGSRWIIDRVERDRSLLPYAAYRTALAALVVRRLRKNQADGRRLRRGRG